MKEFSSWSLSSLSLSLSLTNPREEAGELKLVNYRGSGSVSSAGRPWSSPRMLEPYELSLLVCAALSTR